MVKTNGNLFSTLDINFWAIRLKIEDRHNPTVRIQEKHFQGTCLPLNLKTSQATFQRILSNIIRKHKLSVSALNYVNDY